MAETTQRRSRRRTVSTPANGRATQARSRRRAPTGRDDAIALLIGDHREVEEAFQQFERLGEGATTRKRQVVDRIGELLAVHAGIEETVFYPAIRTSVPDENDDVLEALEEHHLVKTTLAELERTPVEDERFDAKVRVLIENVRHHVKEEEGELFPHVRREVPHDLLVEMRGLLESARAIAPRLAHPHMPDAPPGNLISTALTLPLDLVGRAMKRVMPGRR